MADLYVKEGNAVDHNGVRYEAGELVADLSDKEAQALVNAGVVTQQKPATAESEATGDHEPTPEEVAAAAAAAGGEAKPKTGLFR